MLLVSSKAMKCLVCTLGRQVLLEIPCPWNATINMVYLQLYSVPAQDIPELPAPVLVFALDPHSVPRESQPELIVLLETLLTHSDWTPHLGAVRSRSPSFPLTSPRLPGLDYLHLCQKKGRLTICKIAM